MTRSVQLVQLTHLALPCHNLDKTCAWYEKYTPLRVIHRRSDTKGRVAWIAEPEGPDSRFVLVFLGPLPSIQVEPAPPTLASPAHLGIACNNSTDIDLIAEQGRLGGCLAWEPHLLPPPVGYICALTDPDGNLVEFSYGQELGIATNDDKSTNKTEKPSSS